MIDMTALGGELGVARAEVLADPWGILTLARRTRIWVAMDDPADAEASYRHRTYLKMACVRHVQHVWYRAYPGDPRLEEMLTLTQALIDQTADSQQAEMQAYEFFDDVVACLEPGQDSEWAALVAHAARNTVFSALCRNPDFDTGDPDDDDDALMPDSLEPSYSCCNAVAKGMIWQPDEEVDVEARRAFWLWYLDEAVPWAITT